MYNTYPTCQASQEEARKRDHRVIGKAQALFMFHELSPGCAFMLPHGTRIYNKLVQMLRARKAPSAHLFFQRCLPLVPIVSPARLCAAAPEYGEYGYSEVMTPLLYRKQLWKVSGHLDNYKVRVWCVFAPLFVVSSTWTC